MIELYKDGDSMAILTDAKDEREFIDEISELFARLIEDGEYEHDWHFQFDIWLKQVVDICCNYRGYKNNVSERKILVAGNPILGEKAVHVINKRLKNEKQSLQDRHGILEKDK